MIQGVPTSRATPRRSLTAALAILVGVIAIVGAFHDHDVQALVRAGLDVPTAAGQPLHRHECLACKVSPPLATPSMAPAFIDPGPAASPDRAAADPLPLHGAPRLTCPPRAPPFSPVA